MRPGNQKKYWIAVRLPAQPYESILKNINYLKTLNETCNDTIECYLDHLKRGGIAEKFNKELKEENQ